MFLLTSVDRAGASLNVRRLHATFTTSLQPFSKLGGTSTFRELKNTIKGTSVRESVFMWGHASGACRPQCCRAVASNRCSSRALMHRGCRLRIRPEKRAAIRCFAAAERSLIQVVQDANDVYGETKRPWCQPWTIVLSGSVIVSIFWLLFGHGWWSVVAVGATAAVLLWWYLFLIEYPVLVKQDKLRRQSQMGSEGWEPTDSP